MIYYIAFFLSGLTIGAFVMYKLMTYLDKYNDNFPDNGGFN